MKKLWLHSLVLIALATILLLLLQVSLVWVMPSSQAWAFPVALALVKLAPGLLLGWHTRRHPLLLGAAAGMMATLMANLLPGVRLEVSALFGDTIATAMYVAVAALAGRALRFRFDPDTASSSYRS